MKIINLRKYYPYNTDVFVEVSDEVAACMEEDLRAEKAQSQKIYYHRAYYSLDRGDSIEKYAAVLVESTESVYFKLYDAVELYAAVKTLPEKQKRRFYVHVIYNVSETKIAQKEGVNVSAISQSINKAIKNLMKIMEKG